MNITYVLETNTVMLLLQVFVEKDNIVNFFLAHPQINIKDHYSLLFCSGDKNQYILIYIIFLYEV